MLGRYLRNHHERNWSNTSGEGPVLDYSVSTEIGGKRMHSRYECQDRDAGQSDYASIEAETDS